MEPSPKDDMPFRAGCRASVPAALRQRGWTDALWLSLVSRQVEATIGGACPPVRLALPTLAFSIVRDRPA